MRSFVPLVLLVVFPWVSGCSGSQTTDTQTEAPAECNVLGVWQGVIPGGILMGQPVTLTFYENGMARGTSGNIILDVGWQRQGNELSIVHQAAVPPAAGCRVDQVGRYTISFEGDCSSVVSRSLEDTCEHRRRTLDGLRVIRQ